MEPNVISPKAKNWSFYYIKVHNFGAPQHKSLMYHDSQKKKNCYNFYSSFSIFLHSWFFKLRNLIMKYFKSQDDMSTRYISHVYHKLKRLNLLYSLLLHTYYTQLSPLAVSYWLDLGENPDLADPAGIYVPEQCCS